MKVKIDHIPTAKGVKFGFIGEDGCALSIGFRFSSVEACMKYAFKRGFEVTEIFYPPTASGQRLNPQI